MTSASRIAATPADPWSRWGWLYATVWLAFLVFPVVAALRLDGAAWRPALALVALAAFAVVYSGSWVVAGRDPAGTDRRTPWVLVTLVVLWAVVTTQVGEAALGMLIFVVVLACVLGTPRVAVAGVVGVVGLGVGAALVLGFADSVFLLGLLLLMTVVSVLMRMMEQRRESWQEVQGQMAVAAERERVARDVHDVIGHSLTVIITKAELAERLLERDPGRALAELRSIQSLGRESLTEIRATVSGLRVAKLSEELAGAAEALRVAGIDADVPTDPEVVDPRRRLVLAWVLREAVTNVVRHSGASRCVVELGAHRLVVRDDGLGRGDAAPGNGLRGVAERVRAVGGTLTLADATDGGTRLEVSWA